MQLFKRKAPVMRVVCVNNTWARHLIEGHIYDVVKIIHGAVQDYYVLRGGSTAYHAERFRQIV